MSNREKKKRVTLSQETLEGLQMFLLSEHLASSAREGVKETTPMLETFCTTLRQYKCRGEWQ